MADTEPRLLGRRWAQWRLTWRRPAQLSLSLVLLGLGVLLMSDLLGVRKDPGDSLRHARATIAESLAVQLSLLAGDDEGSAIDRAVSNFVIRTPDVLAAALVRDNGVVLGRYGDIDLIADVDQISTDTHVSVPIFGDGLPWGEVRVVFSSSADSLREFLWLGFVSIALFVSFLFFLRKVLVQLDPERAVPDRVDSAFDLFTAGVVILDDELRIVMANCATEALVDRPRSAMLGASMDSWSWRKGEHWQSPWTTTLHSGLAVSDRSMALRKSDDSWRIVSVSCALVGSEQDDARGVLVTLDDLTPIEERNHELSIALKELGRTQEEITRKNRELERLATTDPLTGLANRRALMERLDRELDRALRENVPLACIMCDIDHFKRINDTYGHAVGDEVIQAVAETLSAVCRSYDLAGRYGGEEFVLLLPGLDALAAREVAERLRIAVLALGGSERLGVPGLSSSFGVAELDAELDEALPLIERADRALYDAKESGRNRVEVYDPGANPPDSTEAAPEFQTSEQDRERVRLVELEAALERAERDLATLREYDTLTGVPMRTLFLQRVDMELDRGRRSGSLVGVMSFELRELERIVSIIGHAASDSLVVAVVERLQAGLRATDLVSSIAGDHSLSRITSNEYGVLLTDLADSAGAMIVVTRLKRLLSQPFVLGDERIYVGANIGIALSLSENHSATELFGQASEARLEAARKPEKVSHGFASAALDDESHDYIRLEADLHDALASGSLETWFQPKFDLVERRITGMEALLRWKHDTRGFVSPAVFVAVAEANGLIGELSSFVLGKTLQQIDIWNAMGFDELQVSINVSPMQLRAESLAADTLDALKKAGIPGRQLEIELTETSVLERPDEARPALEALRAADVGISMDDFGTGYTSLALLADLPLDTVKIDRSFVMSMVHNERNRAIVESIITMAHALKLRVVGEGVETNEELEMLARFGCDEVQGYLISRPQPAEKITEFIVHQRASEQKRRA